MAITSVGYTGSIMTDREWGEVSSRGSNYSVDGAGDFAVTRVPTGDRAVRVAAGTAWGWGILAVNSTDLTVTHPAGSRWDTVVIRRNRDTKQSTVIVLQGTTAKAISSARRVFSGSSQIDDQPIALIQVNATSSVVGEIEDLRCWGSNSGLVATSPLVQSYLQAPGANLRIGGVEWSYEPIEGTWQWVRTDGDTGWLSAVGLGAWGGNPAFRYVGGVVYGRGSFVLVGGAIRVEFNAPQMGSLPAAIPKPKTEIQAPSSNGVNPNFGVRIGPSGAIYIRGHRADGDLIFPTNQYMSLDAIAYPAG